MTHYLADRGVEESSFARVLRPLESGGKAGREPSCAHRSTGLRLMGNSYRCQHPSGGFWHRALSCPADAFHYRFSSSRPGNYRGRLQYKHIRSRLGPAYFSFSDVTPRAQGGVTRHGSRNTRAPFWRTSRVWFRLGRVQRQSADVFNRSVVRGGSKVRTLPSSDVHPVPLPCSPASSGFHCGPRRFRRQSRPHDHRSPVRAERSPADRL